MIDSIFSVMRFPSSALFLCLSLVCFFFRDRRAFLVYVFPGNTSIVLVDYRICVSFHNGESRVSPVGSALNFEVLNRGPSGF